MVDTQSGRVARVSTNHANGEVPLHDLFPVADDGQGALDGLYPQYEVYDEAGIEGPLRQGTVPLLTLAGGPAQLHRSTYSAVGEDGVQMSESMKEVQRLLQEIVLHLSSGSKPDARRAGTKLERISALASTSALTIQMRR